MLAQVNTVFFLSVPITVGNLACFCRLFGRGSCIRIFASRVALWAFIDCYDHVARTTTSILNEYNLSADAYVRKDNSQLNRSGIWLYRISLVFNSG